MKKLWIGYKGYILAVLFGLAMMPAAMGRKELYIGSIELWLWLIYPIVLYFLKGCFNDIKIMFKYAENEKNVEGV